MNDNDSEPMSPRCTSWVMSAKYHRREIESRSVQACMYLGRFVEVDKIPAGVNAPPGCENGNGFDQSVSSPSLYEVYGQLCLASRENDISLAYQLIGNTCLNESVENERKFVWHMVYQEMFTLAGPHD